MGKRIPKTKRHKKLKFVDPCYRGPERIKKGSKLPNQPPSKAELDFDDQTISSGMKIHMDAKLNAKKNLSKTKKKKNKRDPNRIIVTNDLEETQPGMKRRVKPIPHQVAQKKHESRFNFLNRLQKMADDAVAEARIEKKYNLDIVDIDKESGKARFMPFKLDDGDDAAEPSDRQKRKRSRQKEKKAKKKKFSEEKEEDDAKFTVEKIKFGEVALQPPDLNVKPKRAVQTKAGSRDLHLMKLLDGGSKESSNSKSSLDLSQKRKMLLPGQRRMLEEERSRIVDLYRSMKKKK